MIVDSGGDVELIIGEAADFFRPPSLNIRVGLSFGRPVEHLAQVAPPVRRESVHHIVLIPGVVILVEVVVLMQEPQVVGQLLGRAEISGVDVRVGRGVGPVVGFSVDDGHDAVLQGRVQFLRHVVGAQRVLKGQHEFVVFAQHLHALHNE